MATALCPPLPSSGETAPIDSDVSGSFLELIGQLLQLAPFEVQDSGTDSPSSSAVSDDSAPSNEEPEQQRTEAPEDTFSVPVWSTVPVERTVLPWTLSFQSFEPKSPVRTTVEDGQSSTPTAPATPVVAEQVSPKVSSSPIAFVAEIESAPAREPIPDIAVIRTAKPANSPEIPPPAVLETEVRVQQPQSFEPQEHKDAPRVAVESVKTTPEVVEKTKPKQPPKSEALPATAKPSEEQDAPAVQAIRKESRSADKDNPESAKPFTPAPAKKIEKGSTAPEFQSQATPVVPGAPVRESGGAAPEKASDSADLQPATRTLAPEKPAAAPRPPVVRDIAMRVSAETAKPVEIRLSERAGKVEVTVRAQDPELRTALQSDVGHLVERLESDGFHTKAWTPGAPASIPRATESANLSNDTSQHPPQHRGSQQQPEGQRRQHQGDPEIDWMEEFESNRKGGKKR